MERTQVVADGIAPFEAFGEVLPYAHGVRADGAQTLVFVAGQNAFDGDGNLVGPGDIDAQVRQSLENVRLVLEAAGLTMADVVKLTCWVTRPEYAGRYVKIRQEFFGDRLPAGSTVVCLLTAEGALVEIEAIAAR